MTQYHQSKQTVPKQTHTKVIFWNDFKHCMFNKFQIFLWLVQDIQSQT